MSVHLPVKTVVVSGVRFTGLILLLLGFVLSTHAQETQPPAAATVVVPVALVPSPVQVIRELLARPETERGEMLAMYPPGLREPVEAKVREYAAMPAETRELRFLATDLRHYLTQLLPLDVSSQDAALLQVPESIRDAVKARLIKWPILLPQMKEEMLANEQVVRYFTRIGITSERDRQLLLDITPPEVRAPMEKRIAEWNALPEETRTRVFTQVNEFFELTPEEREKSLRILSGPERDAMRETLSSFSNLRPDQRELCIQSFERFSRMSLGERREFLQKAEVWSRLTAAEREQWRELVNQVPNLPPFPPGFVPRLVMPTTNGG